VKAQIAQCRMIGTLIRKAGISLQTGTEGWLLNSSTRLGGYSRWRAQPMPRCCRWQGGRRGTDVHESAM
jgi:hypothetical protein